MADVKQDAPPADKPKKSLFKKPNWQTKVKPEKKENDENNDDDFFSHRANWKQIVEEQERQDAEERRRKRRKEKERKETERGHRATTHHSEETRSSKRRRVSDDNELQGPVSRSKSKESSVASWIEDTIKHSPNPDSAYKSGSASPGKSLSAQYSKLAKKNAPKPEPEIIDLGDSDDDGQTSASLTHRRKEEDEEHNANADSGRYQATNSANGVDRKRDSSRTNPITKIPTHPPAPPPPPAPPAPPAPKINVVVTSEIPNTEPTQFTITTATELGIFRERWCQLQIECFGHPHDFTRKVFLTHNMRKMYDITTCQILKIDPDTLGENADGVGFEAWTHELFEQAKKRREEEKRRAVELPDGEPEEEEADSPDEMRLILKAKDYEPVAAKVKPTHPFHNVAHYFRVTRNIPEEKTITLIFDGERLQPTSTVQETDLEDMETVEVHIK